MNIHELNKHSKSKFLDGSVVKYIWYIGKYLVHYRKGMEFHGLKQCTI